MMAIVTEKRMHMGWMIDQKIESKHRIPDAVFQQTATVHNSIVGHVHNKPLRYTNTNAHAVKSRVD
jgi:hypothetical protein